MTADADVPCGIEEHSDWCRCHLPKSQPELELEHLLHVAATVRSYRSAFRLELGQLAHVHPTVTDARDAMFAALSALDKAGHHG